MGVIRYFGVKNGVRDQVLRSAALDLSLPLLYLLDPHYKS